MKKKVSAALVSVNVAGEFCQPNNFMQVKLTEYNPKEHLDYMSHTIESGTDIKNPHLIKGVPYVFTLEIGKTLLVFKDVAQLKEAKSFFERKIRPSTVGDPPLYEHHWHVWFGRLPKDVLKATNRHKILKAINNALEKYVDTYTI